MNQTKVLRKLTSVMLVVVMLTAALALAAPSKVDAAKAKLSKAKVTIKVGKKQTLKVKNLAKDTKVTWTSNNKKVAAVVKKTGVVTAKKAGKADITATFKGGKLTCKVTVKKAATKVTEPTTEAPKVTEPVTEAPAIETDEDGVPTGAIVWESFEEATAITGKFGSAEVEITKGSDAEPTKFGDSYMKVKSRKNSYDGVEIKLTGKVNPGSTYTISAWVRNDSGTTNIGLPTKVMVGGKETYPGQVGKTDGIKTGEWTLVQGDFTVPSDAEEFSVWVEMGENTEEIFSVDGFSVVPTTKKEEPKDDTISSEGALLFEDFEGDTHKAEPYDGSTLTLTKGKAHGGEQFLKVTDRKTQYEGCGLVATDIVKSGSTYEISVWVRNDSGAAEESLQLCYRVDTGKKDYKNLTTVTAKKGVWTQIKAETTIPDGTSEVFFYIQSPDGSKADYSVDDYVIVAK